ncbi:hypothetical protein DKX38_007183 [Salix brachista]|uniref:Protein kinase domain-containing protein n=1 Tax=Salix brachista TaxID=2182728 RepID=A0A5N5MMG7_9ROSI|nr:hypothetical protein DKX38_007183 [Salix brachista]
MGDTEDNVKQEKKVVFVTVGTTLFDALVRTVDTKEVKQELIRKGYTHLVIQMGRGSYTPTKSDGEDGSLAVDYFTFSPSIADHLRSASLVISHAGSGSIFETLRLGKPLIVVVNEDLMDNHQSELAEELAERKHLYCAHPQTLHQTISDMNVESLLPYPPGDATAVAKLINRWKGYNAKILRGFSVFVDDQVTNLSSRCKKMNMILDLNRVSDRGNMRCHCSTEVRSLTAVFIKWSLFSRPETKWDKSTAHADGDILLERGGVGGEMEPSTTDEPARSHGNHANKHHSSQSQFHDHHHGIGTLSSTSILIIIVSSISVVVVLTIFLIIAMLKRFKYSKDGGNCRDFSSCNTSKFIAHTTIRFTPSPDVKGGCLYGSSMGRKPPGNYKGVQVFTYKELEFATNKFSEANVAGNEGYGVVYRGTLSDGTVAAIKMLHRVDLLSRLYSPYLVELLGYCADQNHRLLVFEFMPNGTLQHHLHHKQYRPLNWGTRLRIALDCARALEFLHELTIPANSMHVPSTTGYLAPECASTGKLTTKSDVYSYGVVLLQLLTGRKPVDTKRPSGEHALVSWALPRLTNRDKVVEMVDPTMQDQYSKKDLIQVAAIAAVCVQPEADYRPLMTDVVQSLIPLVKNLSSVSSSCSSKFMNQMLCSSRPM